MTVSADAIEGYKLDPAAAAKNTTGNGSESDRAVRTTEARPTRETHYLEQLRHALAMQSWRTEPMTSLVLMRHAESLRISLEPSALQAHALPIAILSYVAPLPANWVAIPAGEHKGVKYDQLVFENLNTGKVSTSRSILTRDGHRTHDSSGAVACCSWDVLGPLHVACTRRRCKQTIRSPRRLGR